MNPTLLLQFAVAACGFLMQQVLQQKGVRQIEVNGVWVYRLSHFHPCLFADMTQL